MLGLLHDFLHAFPDHSPAGCFNHHTIIGSQEILIHVTQFVHSSDAILDPGSFFYPVSRETGYLKDVCWQTIADLLQKSECCGNIAV
ncbi:hypothetical protein ES702_03425 [subsurface metagenome]